MIKKDQFLKIIILLSLFILTSYLVYSPHQTLKYPLHVDEWKHISESKKLIEGEYTNAQSKLEVGFHIFLSGLSLTGFNLILVYRFLPMIFASISSLMLFFFVKGKANFITAIFAMLFFASLRSNVNILGLWFFVPLTFVIPLIYLFLYLFTEGVEKNNKRFLIYSFLVLLSIFLVHPISATFMIPMLTIYLIINRKFVKENWQIFLLLLLVPLLALTFFSSFIWQGSIIKTIQWLFSLILFKKGWGIYERTFTLVGLYGLIPIVLAIIGCFFCLRRKRIIFLIWPITTIILILLYIYLDFTLLAPYQRLLYYSMLGLVPLSSIGFYAVLVLLRKAIPSFNYKKALFYSISIVLSLLLIIIIFKGYRGLPEDVLVYETIDDADYRALRFLSNFNRSKVLAPIYKSVAVYPIASHDIVATPYFYGGKKARDDINSFYIYDNCTDMQKVIDNYKVGYVLSVVPLDCGWEEIYSERDLIYKI